MAITLQGFKNVAQIHSNTIIQTSQSRPEGLKGSGFWSRLFNVGGKDAQKNQAVMREFFQSIRNEMGASYSKMAESALRGAFQQGKPLKGYMVKEVLTLLTQEKERIAQFNQETFARWRDMPLPGLGLLSLVEKHLPAGVTLSMEDLEPILRHAQSFAATESRPLSPEELHSMIESAFSGALTRLTPQVMNRLDTICAQGLPPLTPAQVSSLRPFLITTDINLETQLDAVVRLMPDLAATLPRATDIRSGTDMLAFIQTLDRMRTQAFAGLGPDIKGEEMIFLAMQGAFMLNDFSKEQIKEMAAVFCSPAAEFALNTLHGCIDQAPTQQATAGLIQLKGTFTMLLGGFSLMEATDQKAVENLPMINAPGTTPPAEGKAFLHLTGGVADPALARMKVDGNFGALRDFGNATDADLAQLLTCGGTVTQPSALVADGMALLLTLLPKLRQSQPDGPPFTPATVWNILFGQAPGPDVTADNLALKLGQAWQDKVYTLLQKNGVTSEGMRSYLHLSINSAIIVGADPDSLLKLALEKNPAKKRITFSAFSKPPVSSASVNATQDDVLANFKSMAGDLHRLGGGGSKLATITVGNGQPISLDSDSIIDETLKHNYKAGGTDNPIIRSIMQQVDAFCGPNTPQKAQTASLLSQFGLMPLRFLSPALGLGLDEHTPVSMNLQRLPDGSIKLLIESTTEVQGYAKIAYEIDPTGKSVMTDCVIAPNRPA